MALAERVFRSVAYKEQTAFGTLATGTGAQRIRRTNFSLQPNATAIPSQELIDSLQTRGSVFGTEVVQGSLEGELSAGTYFPLIGSALRKDPVAGGSSGALINVTAAAAGKTFTRAAGSWITDGFRVGDVVRTAGWLSPATANNRNYRIVTLTATVMTVAETVVDRAAGDSVTFTAPGRKMWIPATGHTSDWYTFEDWFSDIAQSHVYRDVAVGGFTIGGGPNARASITMPLLGTVRTTGGAQHFTTPAAESTPPSLATTSGSLRLLGADVGVVTGFTLNVLAPPDPVPGMFTKAPVSLGRPAFAPGGSLTIGFEDSSIIGAFDARTEFAIHAVLTESTDVNSEFISIYLPRVQLGSPQIADTGTVMFSTADFEVHELTSGVSGHEQTSVIIQDSRGA